MGDHKVHHVLSHNKQKEETTDRKAEITEVGVEIPEEAAQPIRTKELVGATSGTINHNINRLHMAVVEEEEPEAVQAGVSLEHVLVHVSCNLAREVEATQTVVN